MDTVHKFQGREQDAIILTSVDNVITDFVDDPHMLNVAVSRAVHSLAVVTSQDPRNDQTNYGDLTRYIEYNNFEVIQSQVYSVFDMLYHDYAEQRRAYLQKHKRVSEYDSENLMYSVIQEVLSEEAFSSIGCAVHVSLATLVKNYEPLTEGERQYARNPLTHVDFLLFNQMDKQPVLAIEVDGTGFHEAGSKQAERDMKKNSILEKCGVPLLRLRTDGSGEKEKIRNALKRERLCRKLSGTRSDAKIAEISSKAKLSMILSFAAAAPAPWTADAITFADAETLGIGKNCLKWKNRRTMARWLDFGS